MQLQLRLQLLNKSNLCYSDVAIAIEQERTAPALSFIRPIQELLCDLVLKITKQSKVIDTSSFTAIMQISRAKFKIAIPVASPNLALPIICRSRSVNANLVTRFSISSLQLCTAVTSEEWLITPTGYNYTTFPNCRFLYTRSCTATTIGLTDWLIANRVVEGTRCEKQTA